MANQTKKRKDDQPKELAEARRVPDVIEERKDWIIDKWLERVKFTDELKTLDLSEADRKDHLPDLLDEAVARACGHRVKLEERQKAAERHGTLRYHQGYSIPMLILETYLLQDVMTECIRNNFPININSLVSDMAKISTTLAAELEESARAYMKQYEWHRRPSAEKRS